MTLWNVKENSAVELETLKTYMKINLGSLLDLPSPLPVLQYCSYKNLLGVFGFV